MNHEPIVTGIVYSEGIAVDWIVKNVYWIDAKSGTIGVARTDASHRCWIDAVTIRFCNKIIKIIYLKLYPAATWIHD